MQMRSFLALLPSASDRAPPLAARILLASTVIVAPGVAHAEPTISALEPKFMIVDAPNAPRIHTLRMSGKDLTLPTTNGSTIDKDVSVSIRYADNPTWTRVVNGDPWATPNSYSYDSNSITLRGLSRVGTLVVQLCVRGSTCATTYVSVRARFTTPPVLQDPDNVQVISFGASDSADDKRRITRFRASGLNDRETTCIKIDETSVTAFARIYPEDGWGEFFLPNLTPGSHRISISNDGCNTQWAQGRWSQPKVINAGLPIVAKPGPGIAAPPKPGTTPGVLTPVAPH